MPSQPKLKADAKLLVGGRGPFDFPCYRLFGVGVLSFLLFREGGFFSCFLFGSVFFLSCLLGGEEGGVGWGGGLLHFFLFLFVCQVLLTLLRDVV